MFVDMMYVWHIEEFVIKGLMKYLFIIINFKICIFVAFDYWALKSWINYMDPKCTFYLHVYEPTWSRFAKEGGLSWKSQIEVEKGILWCEEEPTFAFDSAIIETNFSQ